MQQAPLTIRPMQREEVDLAVNWAEEEGWNPGVHDAASFYAADPGGFLLALLEDEPVACISVVQYGSTFAFLGFYIVAPAHRGKGYGMQLWQAGLARLQGRTIGLDGVQAQQANYAKFGFELAYANVRYQGTGGDATEPDANIVNLATLPFEQVNAYDQLMFPAERSEFLRHWLQQPNSIALGLLQDGVLQGYGVVRPCHFADRTGYKIGPLFADSPALAERLFLALKAQAPQDAPLFLDIPAPNPAALDLVTRNHMTPVFETARMYKGARPDLPLEKIFGVTSFELG